MRAALLLPLLLACEPQPDAPPPDSPEPQAATELELCAGDVAIPEDPGASVEGWTAVGGAVIDYNGVAALFLSEAVCAEDAEMRKTVDLPACFMPLAVQLTSNILSSESYGPMDATAARLGEALLDFNYEEFEPRRCVGAAAFHGPGDLVIRPRTAYSSCQEAIAEIGDVSLTVEPACPAPGTVTPFEQWTLFADTGNAASRAEVVDGNLELAINAGFCVDARAVGPALGALALPDRPGAGIRVTVDGDDIDVGPEDFDGGLFFRMGRTGGVLKPGENRICLPRAMRGSTQRLGFVLSHESCSSVMAPERAVVIHPIEMIDDCAETDIVDGSFDEASPMWAAQQIYQPGSARIEGGAATLTATHQCDMPRIETSLSVAGEGMAVVIRYAKTGPGFASASLPEIASIIELVEGQDEARLCLPDSRVGDLATFSLQVATETGGSGSCAEPVPTPTTLVVDEVAMVADSACPP